MSRTWRIIGLACRSLFVHALRSILTVLGIVFGVASVIIMLAIGEAARFEAVEQIRQLGASNIILKSAKPMDEEKKTQQQEFILKYGLTGKDLERILETIPSVVAATPAREFPMEVRRFDRKMETRVISVTPDYAEQANIIMLLGRFFTDTDEAKKTNVCVLGEEAAEKLFPTENPIGRSVRIQNSNYYKVIGVAAKRQGKSLSNDSSRNFDKDVFIPFMTDKVRNGEVLMRMKSGQFSAEKLQISEIIVQVDKLEHVKSTSEIIECLLEQFHPQKDYIVTVPLDLLERAEKTQRVFTYVLGAIASISLIVGGIGIMNIMLATVTERTREIGIRRALGAKKGDITKQFLVETTVLSGLGGILGVLLGVGGAFAVWKLLGLNVIITPWGPIVAFGFSVITGLLFGIYPAMRAASMDPIEALRYE